MPPLQNPTQQTWHLNIRSVVVLIVVLAAGLSVGGAAWYFQKERGQSSLVKEAHALADANKDDLAVSYLNRYLIDSSQDLDALDLKGEILLRSARNNEHLGEVIKLSERILRLTTAPKTPEEIKFANKNTRRLVKAYLGRAVMVAPQDRKLTTAETLARELAARSGTAEDFRLHAQTLELLAISSAGNIQTDYLNQAAASYDKARTLEPNDVAGAEQAARLYYFRLKNIEKATDILESLIRDNPSATGLLAAAKVYSDIAADQATQGQFARSAELRAKVDTLLQQGVAADPKDLQIRLTAADLALAAKRPGEAAKQLANVAEKDRKDVRYRTLMGIVALYENKTMDAIENWKRGLIAAEGSDAELSWRLAYVLLQLGRIDEAEDLITQFRRNYGGVETPSAAHYLQGLKLMKLNQPVDAVAELEKGRAKVLPSLKAQYYYLMGQAREATRDRDQAMVDYATAIEADPKLSAPRLARIRLLQADRPEEASRELLKGLSEVGEDASMLAALAQLELQKQKRLPEARRNWTDLEAILERGRKAAPALPALAIVRAEALATQGKADDAANLLKTATGIDSSDPELWLARAEALVNLGRLDEALMVIDQASDPKVVGDQAKLRILRARILTAQGHGREAREGLIRDEDRVRPDQRPLLWMALGELYTAQGDLESARRAYAKWAEKLPDDPLPQIFVLELSLSDTSPEAEETAKKTLDFLTNRIGGVYGRIAEAAYLLRDRVDESETDAQKTDRLNRAERLVTQIETDAPQLRYGPLLRGILSEKQGNKEKATKAFEVALKGENGLSVLPRLIKLYSEMPGHDADLSRLRETYGGALPGINRLAAELYARGGDKEKAETLARQIVEGNADSLDVRVWQARVLNAMGKPEEAEQTLRELVNKNPQSVGPWLALMYFQISRKDKDAAIKTVESMIAAAKNVERPEIIWAQAWRAVGETQKADENFAAALKTWPDDPRVARAAVEYYSTTNRAPLAEKILRSVLERDPSQRWASRGLAMILSSRLGDRPGWRAAWELVKNPSASGDLPEDRLTRAIVLARGAEAANREESVKMLEQLVEDLPADLPASKAAREMLAKLLLKKDPTKAAAFAAPDAMSPSAGPSSLILHAEALVNAKKYTDADRQIGRLSEMAPDDPATLTLRMRLARARGKGTEAVEALVESAAEKIAKPDGEKAGRLLVQVLLVELEDPTAAEQVARMLIEKYPKDASVLAAVLARQGRRDEALKLYLKAIEIGDSEHIREAAQNALVMINRDNYDPATIALADSVIKAAREKDPTNVDLLTMAGYLAHYQQRYDEELQIYEDALAAQPDDVQLLNNMAWTLSEAKNQPEKALKIVNQAIVKSGGVLPQFYDTRGVIYTRLGKYPEAIQDLELARLDRPTAVVWAHLARAYDKAGMTEKVEYAREQAKNATPPFKPEGIEKGERDELTALILGKK